MMMTMNTTQSPDVQDVSVQQGVPLTMPSKPSAEVDSANGAGVSPVKSFANSPYAHKKADIYTYDKANQEFDSAKRIRPDTYKQFLVQDTPIHGERVDLEDGTLTRYESGTFVKAKNGGDTPLHITSQNGLVLQSTLIKPQDIEEEISDVSDAVKAMPDVPSDAVPQLIEQQVTKDIAEAEIWGQTMSNPDSVSINPESDDIDIQTSTGTFHLDKQDNIQFERADGMNLTLKQVTPSEEKSSSSQAGIKTNKPEESPSQAGKA
jgi:hypothetical protein